LATASTGPKVVSVKISTDGKQWFAAVLSDTGTCFYLADSVSLGGTPLAGTSYFKDTSPTTCIADSTVSYAGDGWK
jgi:uncharacterized membrane protein